jgi:hypothetical protein
MLEPFEKGPRSASNTMAKAVLVLGGDDQEAPVDGLTASKQLRFGLHSSPALAAFMRLAAAEARRRACHNQHRRTGSGRWQIDGSVVCTILCRPAMALRHGARPDRQLRQLRQLDSQPDRLQQVEEGGNTSCHLR